MTLTLVQALTLTLTFPYIPTLLPNLYLALTLIADLTNCVYRGLWAGHRCPPHVGEQWASEPCPQPSSGAPHPAPNPDPIHGPDPKSVPKDGQAGGRDRGADGLELLSEAIPPEER